MINDPQPEPKKLPCGCTHDGTQTLVLCQFHAFKWERIEDQPPPIQASGDMWEAVIRDMKDRRQVGLERYGTPLQAFNGRDSMIDMYQELLDACVYARQYIEEGMQGLGCRHAPGCTHYCQQGHVTADEMVQMDMERIYWRGESERYKGMLETFVEFVRGCDAAILDAFSFTHAPTPETPAPEISRNKDDDF